MTLTREFVLYLAALTVFSILALTALISWIEHEKKAAARALLGAFLLPLPFLFLAVFSFPGSVAVSWILIFLPVVPASLLILPIPSFKRFPISEATVQIDERDTMFSRNELQPNTVRFHSYYQHNPDKKAVDDGFRKKPGLLGKQSQFYHPLFFAATEASFSSIDGFHQRVAPAVSPTRVSVDPQELVAFIKDWLKQSGAHSVGVTRLRDVHFYSHSGRRERYGEKVTSGHRSAIALTVEMNQRMVSCGPNAPTVLESADQYLNAATLAVKTAAFLAQLGYSSRAHIDADYQVVCPLVARDAGLGEIGRMGLLMTPRLGPRVRLSVITTELELPEDPRKMDHSMPEFCQFCEKCATVCPSQAIPKGGMKPDENGIIRWKIDQERCFTYWCQTGTDCGRCIALCPYSHNDNLLHNSVRFLIRHAYFFRRFAALFDDWLYGAKPQPSTDCGWKSVSIKEK